MIVDLTPHDLRAAVLAGTSRHLIKKRQNRQSKYDAPNGTLPTDIAGAIGELVVSKALDLFWSPVTTHPDTDTGDVAGYQVRCTLSDGRLIVRDCDADDQVFIHVNGDPPHMVIRGWLRGAEAKRDEWRKAPNGGPPAYFPPNHELHDWSDLP